MIRSTLLGGAGAPRSGRSLSTARSGKVLAGCLIALAVVLVIIVGIVIFVVLNWKGWVSSGLETVTRATLQQSDLPQSEVDEVMVQFERLTTAFKAGDIDMQRFSEIAERIGNSPVIALGEIQTFQIRYIDASQLDDAQKAAGRLAYDRIMRGTAEGQLDNAAYDASLEPIKAQITNDDGFNEQIIKEPAEVTTEELLACIALANELATAGGVPEIVGPMDLSDELEAILDEELGQ